MSMCQKRNGNAIDMKVGVGMLRQGEVFEGEVALYIVQDAEQILFCWRMNEERIRTRGSNEAESESLGRLPQFTTSNIHSRPHPTTRVIRSQQDIQQMPRTCRTIPNSMDSFGVIRHMSAKIWG